jgi:lipopolysaccharide biosynthesis protein
VKPSRKATPRSTARGTSSPGVGAPKTSAFNRLAIYAFHDPAGIVSDFVLYQLEQLRPHVAKLIVVCNGPVLPEGLAALELRADSVHLRDNQGFDAWAFRAGLVDHVGWERASAFDEVLLLNSTFYGPLFPLSELFDTMGARAADDFWGITAFNGAAANRSIPFHIQSYFMGFRQRLLKAKSFRDYWEKLPMLNSAGDAVRLHEAVFTERLSKQGFRSSVYCDPNAYRVVDPTFDVVDLLLENRCPVLKRRAFIDEPLELERNNVELGRALRLVKEKTSYDTSLIWKDITRAASPNALYTNATLLEVLTDDGEPVALRSDMKVAVLAHLPDADGLGHVVARTHHIPVTFDLHVTTSSSSTRLSIEQALSRSPSRAKRVTIKVLSDAPGPTAALLLGHREQILAGGYDYVCRVHAVRSGVGFAQERHFREHHFDNLLPSRGAVAHLLGMLEADLSIGIVLPPAVHIAHRMGPVDAPEAQTWRKRLNLTVPLDAFLPEVPGASMFWCRPEALAALFDYPFAAADFIQGAQRNAEPLDVTLERLVVPAVHQRGSYARWVLTPESLARSYAKLEYK